MFLSPAARRGGRPWGWVLPELEVLSSRDRLVCWQFDSQIRFFPSTPHRPGSREPPEAEILLSRLLPHPLSFTLLSPLSSPRFSPPLARRRRRSRLEQSPFVVVLTVPGYSPLRCLLFQKPPPLFFSLPFFLSYSPHTFHIPHHRQLAVFVDQLLLPGSLDFPSSLTKCQRCAPSKLSTQSRLGPVSEARQASVPRPRALAHPSTGDHKLLRTILLDIASDHLILALSSPLVHDRCARTSRPSMLTRLPKQLR